MKKIQPLCILPLKFDKSVFSCIEKRYGLILLSLDRFHVVAKTLSNNDDLPLEPLTQYHINQTLFNNSSPVPFSYSILSLSRVDFKSKIRAYEDEILRELNQANLFEELTLIAESKNKEVQTPKALAQSNSKSSSYLRNKFKAHNQWILLDNFASTLRNSLTKKVISESDYNIKENRLYFYLKTHKGRKVRWSDFENEFMKNDFIVKKIGPTPLYHFSHLNIN